MKKLLLLVFFSTIPIYTFSQLVRGRVLDHEKKKPVDFASVFVNGTFLGTTTNEKGEFELDLAAEGPSRKEFAAKRKKTYYGSCIHFFSALWLNNQTREGFRMQEVEGIVPLEYTDFVHIDMQGNKYFTYPRSLEIAYDYHLTTVSFRAPSVYFARDSFMKC